MKGFLFADFFYSGRSRGRNLEVCIYKIITENINVQKMAEEIKKDEYIHVTKFDRFGATIKKIVSFNANMNLFDDFLGTFRLASEYKLVIKRQRWHDVQEMLNQKELLPDEEIIQIFQKTLEQMPKGSFSPKIKKQIIDQITSNLL